MDACTESGNAPDTGYLTSGLGGGSIGKGLLVFSIITVAALAILFALTHSDDTVEAFREYSAKCLLLTLLLLFFDILLGAWRNHVFMHRLDPSVEFATSLRANLANTFVGAITPSQGGGGPAQFYIYHSKGASIGQAVFVAAFNYLSTLVVFISGAVLALVLLPGRFGHRYTGIIVVCFLVFAVELVLLVLAMARPRLFTRLLGKVSGILSRRFPRAGRELTRLTVRITSEVETFRDSSRMFFRGKKAMFPLSLFLTLLLYLNKYVISYTVLLGLGIEADFLTVIAIQAVLMCIIYFSPSPGGSGIAELSIAALMSVVVPESRLGVFTFLQRFFLLYLPMLFGSIVVIGELSSIAGGKRWNRNVPAEG